MDVQTWLEALDARLPLHARVLRRLMVRAVADERIRVLMVGCSIGRGGGDQWSDIDAAMGIATESWDSFLPDIEGTVRAVDDSPPVLLLQHRLAELGDRAHVRVLAEFDCGVQLDLTVTPMSGWSGGRAPGVVALHDPDGWTEPLIAEPPGWRATAEQLAEWHALGWAALSDCAKYLARDSVWEALDRLVDARRMTWRLWAAAMDAPQPMYGVTAVYDTVSPHAPPRMAETLPSADGDDIRDAAVMLANVLDDVSARLCRRRGEVRLSDGFAAAVRERLLAGHGD